jgi:hypothetical protein
VEGENIAKLYLIEIKRVNFRLGSRRRKNEKGSSLWRYIRKERELAAESQPSVKSYLIEIKRVSVKCDSGSGKKGGEIMPDSLAMLLKTNVEKMSVLGLLAILMKINKLKSFSGDVDEKKGS